MADLYVNSVAGSGTAPYDTWAKGSTTLATAVTAAAAGDTIWVASDHSESAAAAKTFSSAGTLTNPLRIICVDRAGTNSSSDLRTTAVVATTGGSASITFTPVASGCTYVYGIKFTAGSSTGNSSIAIGTSTGPSLYRFEKCELNIGGSNASALLSVGQAGVNNPFDVEWIDVVPSFTNSSQSIAVIGANLWWRNPQGGAAVAAGSAYPSTLFSSPTNNRGVNVKLEGLDLNAWGNRTVFPIVTTHQAKWMIKDCRLSSGATISGTQTAPGVEVIATRAASGADPEARHRLPAVRRLDGRHRQSRHRPHLAGAADAPAERHPIAEAACRDGHRPGDRPGRRGARRQAGQLRCLGEYDAGRSCRSFASYGIDLHRNAAR